MIFCADHLPSLNGDYAKEDKENMQDVMIDIETLSTEMNALIVSIAAVKFNVYDKSVKGDSINLLVDVSSYLTCTKEKIEPTDADCPYFISSSTITWWLQQPSYEGVFLAQPRLPLRDALLQLTAFCSGISRYWCQGMNFDPIVLENSYKQESLTPPWKFYEWRDSRTAVNLFPKHYFPLKPVNAHDALADCHYQIENLYIVYERLMYKPPAGFVPEGKDWICTCCGSLNFKKRAVCFKCQKPQPLTLPTRSGSFSNKLNNHDTWTSAR